MHDLFSHGVVMFAFEGWGAAIAIAATAVSAGVGAYAASENASAMGDASDANSYNSLQERLLRDKQYHESRGSTGFANYAEYAKDASGNPIEPQLFKGALETYNFWNQGTPEQQAAKYAETSKRFAPSQAAANQTASGIFDGSLMQEALDATAPVADARRAVATVRKQSGIESLQALIAGIQADQAKKGFTGDSFGNRLLQANVRRNVNTDSATYAANAELENASEIAAIKKKAIGLRLSSLNLPYSMAQQEAAYKDLPENLALQQSLKREQLFSPFKIGVGDGPKVNSMPLVTPVASTGQIAGQAAGSLASGIGNVMTAKMIADQNQANTLEQIKAYQTAPTITSPSAAPAIDWG